MHRFTRGISPAALGLLITLVLAGCNGKSDSIPPIAHKPAPADPWLLTCLNPNVEAPALLWNGQIGIRFGRDGTGSGPMFSIDEYETTGEEKIRTLPNVLAAQWTAGKSSTPLSPKEAKDYSQVIDMRTGKLSTSWSQSVDGVNAKISVDTVLDTNQRWVAQRWTITSASYLTLGYDAKAGEAKAERLSGSDQSMKWSLPPSGLAINEIDVLSKDVRRADPREDTTVAWSADRAGLSLSAATDSSQPFVFERFLSFGESPQASSMSKARLKARLDGDDFPDVDESHWAYKDLARPKLSPFDQVASFAKSGWNKRWETDIEIDGPVEDQQAVRSFLFYLRSGIDANGQMSISPFGLSNALYNGHVFWDADIWVFPALALIDPQAASAIANYRVATRTGAMTNQDSRNTPDKPHIDELEPGNFKAKFPAYAWESSVTGKETAPMAMREEIHINGDVAWMLGQAGALGLVPASTAQKAAKDAADFFYSRAQFPEERYIVLNNVVSPDESHTGNNDLYTNLLAQWCANGGTWNPKPYDGHPLTNPPPPSYKLPRDKETFLTYDNDALRSYKQASAVLSIYPLQYPPAEKEAKRMMDRFADKVTKAGPAMSDSLHALIWARLGETDKAYDSWKKSWQDFVKEPHLQFSEKRKQSKTYFTTGAAGCLQTVLYGFLGFRIDSKEQDGASWSTKLALGRILSVKPNLPVSWKSVKLKNFTVMGRRYTLIATHKGVQVIQGDK